MPRPPWRRDRGLGSVLARWRSDPALAAALCLDETLPARAGEDAPLPPSLDPRVAEGLRTQGIARLYTHQAEALALASAGGHLVVATPTASGKSLCFHLPLLHRLAAEPRARALYLLPTRALARDQARSLDALLQSAGLPARALAYDGDTAAAQRRVARDEAAVLLTNPDMLHTGLLPHHTAWSGFFGALRFVVVDEVHAYGGVFGAHVANVLRRLVRVARFHGASPTFLTASATIANAADHTGRIVGATVTAVERSGAPGAARTLLVADPARAASGGRARASQLAVRMAADLVGAGVSTLVFGASRAGVETLTRYLRQRLAPEGVAEEAVQAYRGGYLSDTRRRIETGLRDGSVRCVVATNALELGVDVGALDAVVCVGWPGTRAALWQRFGRAGRRQGESLAALVLGDDPLDRFVARDPQYVVRAPVEEARVDPNNLDVLMQHLQCASFELPFDTRDSFGDLGVEATQDALAYLAQHGVVHANRGRWHWVAEGYPAAQVSLRTAGWERVLVRQRDGGETLAELDLASALRMVHPRAVYQHEGVAWWVEALDLEARTATVVPSPHDWFTEPVTRTRIEVTEAEAEAPIGHEGAVTVGVGEVTVRTQVTGFRRVRFGTHEPIGHERLDLPEMETATRGVWLALDGPHVAAVMAEAVAAGLPAPRSRVYEGLRGVAYALRTVASLALMCAPQDLGVCLGGAHDAVTAPADDDAPDDGPAGAAVFLYDSAAGGAGLSAGVYTRRDALLALVYDLVSQCPCVDGCPGCVGLPLDGGDLGRKPLALRFVAWMLPPSSPGAPN